jgi:hypothetical protein
MTVIIGLLLVLLVAMSLTTCYHFADNTITKYTTGGKHFGRNIKRR